jgi:flagellar assembly protein FliH
VQAFRRWRPEAIAASAPPSPFADARATGGGSTGPADAIAPHGGAEAREAADGRTAPTAPGACPKADGPTLETTSGRPQPDWPTAAELEGLRESARDEGYREGIAQAQAQAARLVALVESLRGDAARLEAELAAKLLDLAVDIAREVVRGTLAVSPEALLPVIHEALAALPQTLHHVTLHMHPDDATLVSRHLQDHPLMHPVRVRPNAAITLGGCRITANEADLDASIETRWERVIAKLGRADAWNSATATGAGGSSACSGGGD